jgi:cytochrome c oxidase assembly factor CtaG
MHEVLAPWSVTGIAIAVYIAVACLHLNHVRTARGHPAPPRDELAAAALFQAGLLTALLAVISPVSYWSSQYIWVRAIQDLLLCFAAPMLIASGIRGRAKADMDRPPPDRAWSRVSPVAATVALSLSCMVWHVPALFDAVPASAAARLTEYAVYLGAGSWFWLQILRPHPGPWQSPLRRLGLLTGTLAAWTVLGMVLVFGSNVIYPAYANSLHHAMSVLDDQQTSGAVLWMGMMPFLVTAGVILLTAWLSEEDSDSLTDAEASVRKREWGWTARSGLR